MNLLNLSTLLPASAWSFAWSRAGISIPNDESYYGRKGLDYSKTAGVSNTVIFNPPAENKAFFVHKCLQNV